MPRATIKPAIVPDTTRLDALTKRICMARTFAELVGDPHRSYMPTLRVDLDPGAHELAEAYDAHMKAAKDPRRASRLYPNGHGNVTNSPAWFLAQRALRPLRFTFWQAYSTNGLLHLLGWSQVKVPGTFARTLLDEQGREMAALQPHKILRHLVDAGLLEKPPAGSGLVP